MLALTEILQKNSHDCGKACATCVLNYHGVPNPAKLVVEPIDGCDPRSLEIFFRKVGFRVLSGEMTLGNLKHFTDLGWPVVAVLKGHYVVVGGVGRGKVHFMDPAEGLTSDPVTAFLARWFDGDRLGAEYNQFGIAVWQE